jgi:hypothetical protein
MNNIAQDVDEPEDDSLSLEVIESMILDLKMQNLEVSMEREKIMKANKLQFFIPSHKQRIFIENADKKRRAVFAGNRFGKSTIGVVEDCCFAIGFRPFFEEGDPLRYLGIPDRGVKILVIAEDWDKVREIFTSNEPGADRMGKFLEWLPAESIAKCEKNSLGVVYVIHIVSTVHGRTRKSSIYFDTVRSFKTNGAAHESSDWDVIHCDEPIPNDMWVAATRGLIDRKGHAWALLTPLREAWLYDYMCSNAVSQPEIFHVLHAEMLDNPTLDAAEAELFLSQLSPEERACRAAGIPLQSGRLVYHSFNEAKHLIKGTPAGWENPWTPPDDWDIAFAIDPHPQTPHAVLFVAISPIAVVFFADLFVKCPFGDNRDEKTKEVIIEGLSTKIRRLVNGRRTLYQICDPCAWIKDPETNRAWVDALYEAGLTVEKASKAKTTGILEANEWLSGTKGKKMFVTESCPNFLREIRKYHYDKENKPVDRDDHIMECFYRLVMKDGFSYYGEDTSVASSESYDDEAPASLTI